MAKLDRDAEEWRHRIIRHVPRVFFFVGNEFKTLGYKEILKV